MTYRENCCASCKAWEEVDETCGTLALEEFEKAQAEALADASNVDVVAEDPVISYELLVGDKDCASSDTMLGEVWTAQ